MKTINHLHFSRDIDPKQWEADQDCITLAMFGQHVYREIGKQENGIAPPYNADYIEYTPATCTERTAKVIRHVWINGHTSWSAGWEYIHELYSVTWRQ